MKSLAFKKKKKKTQNTKHTSITIEKKLFISCTRKRDDQHKGFRTTNQYYK
jgi:hypothetical protein